MGLQHLEFRDVKQEMEPHNDFLSLGSRGGSGTYVTSWAQQDLKHVRDFVQSDSYRDLKKANNFHDTLHGASWKLANIKACKKFGGPRLTLTTHEVTVLKAHSYAPIS